MTINLEVEQVEMKSMEEIKYLIYAKASGILVNTFEESRLEKDLKVFLQQEGYDIYSYTIATGLKDYQTLEVNEMPLPQAPIKYLMSLKRDSVLILKDYHHVWKNPPVMRLIRDFLESPRKQGVHLAIIFISPLVDIPLELEKLISYVDYELPTHEDIHRQVSFLNDRLRSQGLETLEGDYRKSVENALVGMTLNEAVFSLKKSVVKNNRVDLNDISKEKEQVIKKTGLLEYVTRLGNMEDVGGLDNLKVWLDDSYHAFNSDAKDYKIDPPKGIVLAGFPGSGKSLTAKSIASSWNLPLLKMNMSDIMDSLVGKSEQNMSRALKLAEAVSPCVLWIDEIEKSLAGANSAGGDSGTSKRVFSDLLTWMSDKTAPVFVGATANDITTLPPELTRAGRFDDIFYLGVPGENERVEILKIHLEKRGYTIGDVEAPGQLLESDIRELASRLDGFTGAEIEQIVRDATRRVFSSYMKKEKEDHYIDVKELEASAEKTIPLSKRNPILLDNLREWARTSAICASSEEHEIVHNINKQVGDPNNLFDF